VHRSRQDCRGGLLKKTRNALLGKGGLKGLFKAGDVTRTTDHHDRQPVIINSAGKARGATEVRAGYRHRSTPPENPCPVYSET